VREIAPLFADKPVSEINKLLEELLSRSESKTISRMLNVCAFNETKISAPLLCRCIGPTEAIFDTAPCFSYADASAIEQLLETAKADEISWQRQVYAAHIAAELTVKFDLDRQRVRKVLWKLDSFVRAPESRVLIGEALDVLDRDTDENEIERFMLTEMDIADFLPEHRPPVVIESDEPIRRPIPKLGRNDPCHCGSGKKYKKCCLTEDKEVLRDASPYEGITRSQLSENPGLVDDPMLILGMRAHEIKSLNPKELSARQLIAAARKATAFAMRDFAFEILLEYQQRDDTDEYTLGHFEELMDATLVAGDLDLAKKILDHMGEKALFRPEDTRFRFDLLEHPEWFRCLETNCRNSICEHRNDDEEPDAPLVGIAHNLSSKYPALSIAFARAAIATSPHRYFDNEMLLDVIREARVDLDLEPWGDPAEEVLDAMEADSYDPFSDDSASLEASRLANELKSARSELEDKVTVLREMETKVQSLTNDLEAAHKSEKATEDTPATEPPPQEPAAAAHDATHTQETLLRLREKVETLKAEITRQQEQRKSLRHQLAEERKRKDTSTVGPSTALEKDKPPSVEPTGRIIIPEYSGSFLKSCESLPPAIVGKALIATSRFAAHDKSIWRHTKSIERMKDSYRIRIGINHRLMLRWIPSDKLEVMDLITRQDLEAWIKKHGR